MTVGTLIVVLALAQTEPAAPDTTAETVPEAVPDTTMAETPPAAATAQGPASAPDAPAEGFDPRDELRRAKNEYAYGNYEESVRRLRKLLYPMRLSSDEQVIEARRYLALSYYLLDQRALMNEEFTKLLFIDPDYELDPFSIAPPVIEIFEDLRQELAPELDVIRQRRADERLQQPSGEGILRTINRRVTEKSELATFLPFGVGQFQNGDTELGVFFAVSEGLLLAANVAAFLYARYGIGTGFSEDERNTVRALAFAQYGSLVLFGAVYSVGVYQARLRFVPVVESPPVIEDQPLAGDRPLPVSPGVLFSLEF